MDDDDEQTGRQYLEECPVQGPLVFTRRLVEVAFPRELEKEEGWTGKVVVELREYQHPQVLNGIYFHLDVETVPGPAPLLKGGGAVGGLVSFNRETQRFKDFHVRRLGETRVFPTRSNGKQKGSRPREASDDPWIKSHVVL